MTHDTPPATADLLNSLPRRVPPGANRMLVHGKHCCAPYVVRPPYSLLRCATPGKAQGAGDEPRKTEDC